MKRQIMSKLGKLDLDGGFQNDKIVNLQLITFMCYTLCFDYSRCFNLMEDAWKNMMLTCSFNEGLPCKSIASYESHN